MHKGFSALLISALTVLLAACGKDPAPVPVTPATGARVLIACEGSYGTGNSALSLYLPDSDRATEDIYKAVNSTGIGDVFQSITRIGDRYFLCVNNSNKIIVAERNSIAGAGSIAIPKPRYILPVGGSKAYVSTLYSNKVYVINTVTLAVTDTIMMPRQNPEGMLLAGNTAYICTWDTASSALYPVNTATNETGSGIPLPGRAPQELQQDREGMLWVLSGNKYSGTESRLTRLNPATGAVLSSYSFGAADPLRLAFNPAKDTLYFIEVSYAGGALNNGVYRMGIHDAALPAQAFIPAQGLQYFYGIGIHPGSGYIYVADPLGFTQRGRVTVYRPDGSTVATFSTGVGPGHFLFD